MAHPQHNFTSNFNGSEGHNAELTLNINGAEHKYTPAGNDKEFTVTGAVRIDINLDGSELAARIMTVLDGDSLPLLVQQNLDGTEDSYTYVGLQDNEWLFGRVTTTHIDSVAVSTFDGAVRRETLALASDVAIVAYNDPAVYTKLRTAVALDHLPVLDYQGTYATYVTIDNNILKFATEAADPNVESYVYTVASDNTVTATPRNAGVVRADSVDTEPGTLIDKLEVVDNVRDPEDVPLLQLETTVDGQGNRKVAINEDGLHEALNGLGETIDNIVGTIDELDMDSVPHAYLRSTLNQSAGDSVTTGTQINVFALTADLVGDCFEFEQTTNIDDTPYGYLWIEPGTYLINGSVTLQWVGNPRGTFVAKVGKVMGENVDFSQEQELLRSTTRIVTIPNRRKLSINITYDAGTPSMGFWIQSLQVVKLAGGMSQTTVAHGLSLEGNGSVENPLDISDHGLREAFDYTKNKAYFATKQELVPLATSAALQAETARATQRENEIEELFTLPTQEAVDAWLNAHPEATTTVQDHSLTEHKFTNDLVLKTVKDYVTPEMFGAKGDGEIDDTDALQAAVNSGKMVVLVADYSITESIVIPTKCRIQGYGNPVIRVKADLESVLNLNGGNITIKNLSIVCAGQNVTYGIYCPNENSRFFFEKVYIQHIAYGFYMRSYLTKLIGCEVYDFIENGFTFIGVSSTEYNYNTSLLLLNCYARKASDDRGKVGYSITDVIYSSLISCAADHCEVAYDLTRCQSTSLVSCGCENFSSSAVVLHGLCRGVEIISLFAGFNNAHSLVRCYGTNYLRVGEVYWNGAGTIDYAFYSSGAAFASLPDIFRLHPIQVYKTSIISFNNKITYEPENIPTSVYDGDICIKNNQVYLANKNTSSDSYSFNWLELEKAGVQLSGGFSGSRRVVIGLCEIGVSGTGVVLSSGKLIFSKPDGLSDLLTEIHFTFQRKGTSTTEARFTLFGTSNEMNPSVTLDGTENIGDFTGYRPVTFTGYNGVKFAGIEFYCGNIGNPNVFLKAIERNTRHTLIEWYDQSTHTILNNTVANSITTLSNPNQMIINRAKFDSYGNLIKAPANYPSAGTYSLKLIDGVVQWVADV